METLPYRPTFHLAPAPVRARRLPSSARALIAGVLLVAPWLAAAATFTVTSPANAPDALSGDGLCAAALPDTPCTLRAAVDEANRLPGPDAIDVPAGVYPLDEEVLDISDDVTITGAGPSSTEFRGRLTGNAPYSTSLIYNKATTSVSGVTLSLIVREATRSAQVVDNLGGTMFLDTVDIVGNLRGSTGNYNFVTNHGTMHITNANVGGSIRALDSADAIVNERDLSGTSALMLSNVSLGGRLRLDGPDPISAEMLFNSGARGGTATVTMTNVTAAGTIRPRALGRTVWNEQQDGASRAEMTLTNVTLSGRTPSLGTIDGRVTVANSIVQNGCVPATYESLGHNIDGGTDCGFAAPGDRSATPPSLRRLAANGAFVKTQALRPGSPAIDAGDDAACPPTDARGAPRPADGDANGTATCDVGAYEVAP